MTYEEIVAILGGGGEQPVEEVPDFFPRWVAKAAATFLGHVGEIPWPYMPADNSFSVPTARAALVRSTSFFTSVTRDDDGDSVILVPVGLLARTWVLSRLLFEFWEEPSKVMFANSPLDMIDPGHVFLPDKYKPLLGDIEDPDEWWCRLRELNAGLADVSKFDHDSAVMTLHVLYFVVFHELQHVHYRHDEFRQAIGAAARADRLDEIRRGLELQADYFASWHVAEMLTEMIHKEGYSGERDHWDLYMRLCYGVTMLLGAMDSYRKYVHCFHEGIYAHPIVRHQVFSIAGYRGLGDNESETARLFYAAEREAWKRCVQAYTDLSLRLMKDHSAEVPAGMFLQPVQALMYGGLAAASRLDKLRDQEMEIMARVTDMNRQFLKTRQVQM